MKTLKASLVVVLLSLTCSVFANTERTLTDDSGESCTDKVSRITKQYFEVADTQERLGFGISKEDQFETLNFKNTTPGTYNQEFIATIKIKLDRSQNAYRPKKDQKVKIKFSGDFDCDNLKVKDLKALGGVERID